MLQVTDSAGIVVPGWALVAQTVVPLSPLTLDIVQIVPFFVARDGMGKRSSNQQLLYY